MFGKGNFDGQFRTTPNVSIRGATKSESKEQLLKRAHHERLQREAQRNETSSAVKIQSLVRGHLARVRQKKQVRKELESLYQAVVKGEKRCDLPTLHNLGVLLLHCWSPAIDQPVFAWYSQMLVKQRQEVLAVMLVDTDWQFLVCRLLSVATSYLLDTRENLASSLRFMQVFTCQENYSANGLAILTKVYKFLIKDSYFAKIRKLIDTKIPPLLAVTTRPPTPLSEEILQMVLRPLDIVDGVQDRAMVNNILRQLCENIFCGELTEQVRLFILPSLASHSQFPLTKLVQSLLSSDGSLAVSRTTSMLYSFLAISRNGLASILPGNEQTFLAVLTHLCCGAISTRTVDEPDDSDTESITDMELDMNDPECLTEQCISILNNKDFVNHLISLAEKAGETQPVLSFSGVSGSVHTSSSVSCIRYLCTICHQLLLHNTQALHDYCLLYTLAFRPNFLHQLWAIITTTSQPSIFGSPTPLISLLSRGIKMSARERDEIVPQLAVFSSMFGYLLVTIHDTEFYNTGQTILTKGKAWMPFTLSELVPMSLHLRDIALGLVELAFPESRPSVREDYRQAVNSVRTVSQEMDDCPTDIAIWSHMFKSVVGIVRQLYNRDTRRQFCPSTHWINPKITLPLDRPQDISFRRSRIRAYRPFRGLRVFTRDELEETGPPLTTKEVRLATVLRELPFTISFGQRVLVFQNLIQRDKQEHQGDRVNFMQGPHIDLLVRRNYIYEDSFDKLSRDNEPNLRLKMRVQLVNAAGLDEAGIDGGGLFREFLSQLLKAAFDPNRGFFALTLDQMLYPNPTANQLHGDSTQHYFFIGRILGKALYENMLVELPLATFFLSKLLGQTLINVDIDHLDSLDPELYKNLLYLKTYDGDVQDLGLDFTIAVEDFGENRIELLKAEGDEIAVTNENRIEYIHLVADYKLNRQIKQQCNAFRAGLSDVIGMDWLRMFSSKELSTLISGAEHEISVADLQGHTNYSGGYEMNHPTITAFWQVVTGFDEEQKRSLLKFVTSCSRPPLLGFKDLDPPFCIQNAGSEPERLPTASTCMNLLKLPDFRDAVVLKKKLIYAIESGAGFELS
eukprot:GFUD01036847.1.p1 GENE.GFUD01036847.1~~GFUD01036847.1.p1  ORF type:complete len:1078 (-),score=314.76 GFUD01036847.1:112-3345(-)